MDVPGRLDKKDGEGKGEQDGISQYQR